MERALLAQQLRAAMTAHELWRAHLVSAVLTGRAGFSVTDAQRTDRCEFGLWLLKIGDLPEVPQVAAVRPLHAAFHEAAAQVVDMALAGRRAEATRALGPGSAFDKASNALSLALRTWAASV